MPCSIVQFLYHSSPPQSNSKYVLLLLQTIRRRVIDHPSTQLKSFYQYNMSDPSRQSMTDKASAAVKVCFIYLSCAMYTYRLAQPDSQKSMLEQAGDKMKSTLDSGAASVQSDVSFFFLINHHADRELTHSFTIEPKVHLPESQ